MPIANQQDQATLVMLSGGPHSLYVLIDLLAHTRGDVFAHHVQLKARNRDPTIASQTCQQIIDYCSSHYRTVDFSQSLHDYQELTIDGGELTCIAFEAGLAMQSRRNDYGRRLRCVIAGAEGSERNAILAQHLQNCADGATFPGDPPKLQQIYVNHERAVAAIPPEIKGVSVTAVPDKIDHHIKPS